MCGLREFIYQFILEYHLKYEDILLKNFDVREGKKFKYLLCQSFNFIVLRKVTKSRSFYYFLPLELPHLTESGEG